MLALGFVSLLIAQLLLASSSGYTQAMIGVTIWGLHLGLTQGLLSAMVADSAPDHLRGRVMGVWGLTWFLAPAGGFVAASLAEWLGASAAVAIGALSVSAFALFVYLGSADVRSIPSRDEMTSPS